VHVSPDGQAGRQVKLLVSQHPPLQSRPSNGRQVVEQVCAVPQAIPTGQLLKSLPQPQKLPLTPAMQT